MRQISNSSLPLRDALVTRRASVTAQWQPPTDPAGPDGPIEDPQLPPEPTPQEPPGIPEPPVEEPSTEPPEPAIE